MTVECWIGQEFEQAHEMRAFRMVLQQLVEHFSQPGELICLLANFYCNGADIDLAVIKERAVILIELKECDQAVSGSPNGEWRIQNGAILNQGRLNPYQQVRQYRYALMNYLSAQRSAFLPEQKARQVSFEHVAALVVFSPNLAPGSRFEIPPRDRKWFGVFGLDKLWEEIKDRRSDQIHLDQGSIRKFAAQVLNLKRVDVQQYLGVPEPEEPVVPAEVAAPPPPAPKPAVMAAPEPLVVEGSPALTLASQPVALDIVNALRRGTVPSAGLPHLAVGLEREMRAITNQLRHVATGRGDFKFVRGAYGAGKTFLSALVLEEALRQGFAASSVIVSTDTPLYRLESIYHRVIGNLRTRSGQSGALRGMIDRWIYQLEEKVIELEGYEEDDPRLAEQVEAQFESGLSEVSQIHSAFSSALRGYYRAQLSDDYATAQALIGWLSGEQQTSALVKRKVNIRGEIDNTVALEFLRAVNLIARKAGLAGIVIAFDEVETIQRLRGPQREQSLSTLRQFVDAADHGYFPYTYLMFTGTPGFFEDRLGVPSLQPLHDRIKLDRPDDPYPNPELPQISLPLFDTRKLQAVSQKVLQVYSAAYEPVDRKRLSDVFIDFMISEVTSKFGGRVDVVPRQFLRDFVNVLDKTRQYPDYNPDSEYEFDRNAATELTPVEQEVIEPITF